MNDSIIMNKPIIFDTEMSEEEGELQKETLD